MIKKLINIFLFFSLVATTLFAGKGKIRVASDVEGAYIYVDGKKKAMTGEGYTSILLEEGEHIIKVLKPKDKYMGYIAEKKVFVGEDTSTKIILKPQLQATYIEKLWDKTFGGKDWDDANSVIQTKDGGFMVAGAAGSDDVWVIKLDKYGKKLWDKTFGGKDWVDANSVIQTRDGGFMVAGYTESKGAGKSDVWVIKLDKYGKKLWDKTFGGKNTDVAYSIIQTRDGGFMVAGRTQSKGAGYIDVWIIKFLIPPLLRLRKNHLNPTLNNN